MKVIAFEPDYNAEHREALRAFAAGIPGAEVRPVTEYEWCDVAVIFGSVKAANPHTHSKGPIMDRHGGDRRLIMIEAAFQKRGEYYAVGWDQQAGHADFNTGPGIPIDRWGKLGIRSKRWRTGRGGTVLVIGQLPRDTQVQNVDHLAWCQETFEFYRDRGDLVLFRPHPMVDDPGIYGIPRGYLDFTPIEELRDLNIRCAVTWNSTFAVDAVIQGIPVIAMDKGSMAWEVASHDLTILDHKPLRSRWLAKIGYAQWTLEEMRQGLPWKHLTS